MNLKSKLRSDPIESIFLQIINMIQVNLAKFINLVVVDLLLLSEIFHCLGFEIQCVISTSMLFRRTP